MMVIDRVNARLPETLARHVGQVVHTSGIYETPSEYIRALIRADMESDTYRIYGEIVQGWKDIAEERYFEGTGDFKKDMELLKQKQEKGWE